MQSVTKTIVFVTFCVLKKYDFKINSRENLPL